MAKIVVVEDEVSLHGLLEELLAGLGHRIFTAANGQAGMRLIEQECPDLVVSDVMMPLLDGYALLRQVRHHPRLQLTKVILMSAAPFRQAGQVVADAYLAKPYDLEELEQVVQRLIGTTGRPAGQP